MSLPNEFGCMGRKAKDRMSKETGGGEESWHMVKYDGMYNDRGLETSVVLM